MKKFITTGVKMIVGLLMVVMTFGSFVNAGAQDKSREYYLTGKFKGVPKTDLNLSQPGLTTTAVCASIDAELTKLLTPNPTKMGLVYSVYILANALDCTELNKHALDAIKANALYREENKIHTTTNFNSCLDDLVNIFIFSAGDIEFDTKTINDLPIFRAKTRKYIDVCSNGKTETDFINEVVDKVEDELYTKMKQTEIEVLKYIKTLGPKTGTEAGAGAPAGK